MIGVHLSIHSIYICTLPLVAHPTSIYYTINSTRLSRASVRTLQVQYTVLVLQYMYCCAVYY